VTAVGFASVAFLVALSSVATFTTSSCVVLGPVACSTSVACSACIAVSCVVASVASIAVSSIAVASIAVASVVASIAVASVVASIAVASVVVASMACAVASVVATVASIINWSRRHYRVNNRNLSGSGSNCNFGNVANLSAVAEVPNDIEPILLEAGNKFR